MTDARANAASLRAWCFAAAAASVLFAAYVSLVPFTVKHGVSMHDAATVLLQRSAWILASRSNFIGNIVMYLPVGFFAAGAVFRRRGHVLLRAALVPIILLLSLTTSVAIESAQAFVPERIPSVADCVGQIIGALVGLVTWLVVQAEIHTWWDRRRAGAVAGIPHVWFSVYLVVYGLAALLPLDVTLDAGILARKWRAGQVIINPLNSPSWSWTFMPALLGDVILAIPLGLLASIAGVRAGMRRKPLTAVLIVASVLAVIEMAQVFVLSRTADSADFLVALSGAILGVGIATSLSRGVESKETEDSAFSWRLAGLVLALVAYAAYNWSPFNPTLSASMVRERLHLFWQPPFYQYYLHTEVKALGDALIKIAMSAPIGFFWALFCARRVESFRRIAFLAGLAGASTFAAVVELGQVLLPSRYPDTTDVLLAVGGFVAGTVIARALVKRGREAVVDQFV